MPPLRQDRNGVESSGCSRLSDDSMLKSKTVAAVSTVKDCVKRNSETYIKLFDLCFEEHTYLPIKNKYGQVFQGYKCST